MRRFAITAGRRDSRADGSSDIPPFPDLFTAPASLLLILEPQEAVYYIVSKLLRKTNEIAYFELRNTKLIVMLNLVQHLNNLEVIDCLS